MKQNILLILLLIFAPSSFARTTYDSLEKLDGITQNVYYSKDAKARALKISNDVIKAEAYFQKQFKVKPTYNLLVLSPTDWKKYAHPQAIYGMPHYLPDGRLVVASENNDFWKRNIPPIDKIPTELASKIKEVYTDKNGDINLTNAFDLLAIHELGHTFQKSAGLKEQRNWLSELFCNVLLHTYLAENDPAQLPYITTFTKVSVQTFPPDRLKYKKLEDFEAKYNEIAMNHPDNYGWYQCKFHVKAGEIYDAGGVPAMQKMWHTLLSQKEKLTDEALMKLLQNSVPVLEQATSNWGK